VSQYLLHVTRFYEPIDTPIQPIDTRPKAGPKKACMMRYAGKNGLRYSGQISIMHHTAIHSFHRSVNACLTHIGTVSACNESTFFHPPRNTQAITDLRRRTDGNTAFPGKSGLIVQSIDTSKRLKQIYQTSQATKQKKTLKYQCHDLSICSTSLRVIR